MTGVMVDIANITENRVEKLFLSLGVYKVVGRETDIFYAAKK